MSEPRSSVLVVDDVASNIHVLAKVLGAEHDIYAATNGADALAIAVESQPDLILLDVMMPEMDGYEVSRRLKATPEARDIPIIFVTALKDEMDEARGLEAGAIDYIVKPISAPIVQARVRNHIELKRYRDQLKTMTLADGLTGIANRRRFDEELLRDWHRSLRSGAPLAVVMADVDHFKQYNDHYGHLRGDGCLRTVAGALREATIRLGDLAARFGGEEFVLLLPETTAENAVQVAQRARVAVENLALPHAASPTSDLVTLSLGVSAVVPDETSNPESLVAAADRALYRAKRKGRNRVELA